MKYVQINSFYNGSTGTIMRGLHKELLEQGHDSYVFWGRRHETVSDHERCCASKAGVYAHGVLTRLTGRAGFYSKRDTARLLAELDEIDPDVVHLHNVHGYYVNVEMLFEWLAAHRCQVKWTLHDCWAFTGHCAHFTYVKCAQWKTRCAYEEPCCQLSTYPKTISKRSCTRNFDDKKRIFNLISADRMELITPSQWLADLVGESFLSKYPVTVKHNEIDRAVFKPTSSDFCERYGLDGKFVILGVASPWTERKGLGDFVRLANVLDDRCAIVLVGLTRRQIKKMTSHILSFGRLEDPKALARVYTAADLFVHPGVEETYGLAVAEAQACGTPVLVRSRSACEEAVQNGECHTVDLGFDALKSTVITVGGGCSVICLERTESKQQMAAIYSAADVFFNPTREDNFPTVNLEAQACGTPVLTYDTGGCEETINLEHSQVIGG
ncbi:glycosyl transferase [Gordonibacter sp. 28C]|uniref:glycosyltransferase n=1 Tax=Gordonibacter sp. 28C TaxID=2078569 RepID=UPI000DF7E869|nr:glycosyltransferase [Gordonibacter sp. 28C]RDB60537.1 glycosyl transferase [Gordonibacter sp. 28C]